MHGIGEGRVHGMAQGLVLGMVLGMVGCREWCLV